MLETYRERFVKKLISDDSIKKKRKNVENAINNNAQYRRHIDIFVPASLNSFQ